MAQYVWFSLLFGLGVYSSAFLLPFTDDVLASSLLFLVSFLYLTVTALFSGPSSYRESNISKAERENHLCTGCLIDLGSCSVFSFLFSFLFLITSS